MSGLQAKYKIEKADGTPVNPKAKYFVLRYDEHQKDEAHKRACQEALKVYASEIAEDNDELARDLFYSLEEEEDIDALGAPVPHLVNDAKEFMKLDNLEMHERKHLRDDMFVTRVPGGLIYVFYKQDEPISSVFVPGDVITENWVEISKR